jgi:hypothetical protein
MLVQRRRLRGAIPKKKMPASVKLPAAVHRLRVDGAPGTALLRGAVVVTVILVVPLPVTDGGLKAHVAPNGSPWHELEEKLMVPV